jgi:hypothetical protein
LAHAPSRRDGPHFVGVSVTFAFPYLRCGPSSEEE